MMILCFLKAIWYSLKTMEFVSGHDYLEIYDNKDLQVLKCLKCNHISVGFKEKINDTK